MNFGHVFLTLVAFFLVASSASASAIRLSDAIRNSSLVRGDPQGERRVAAAIREIRLADGCDPNICFAIDGSKQLGAKDFELQKDFLAIVTAIIGADERAHFSGVQYGLRTSVIRNIRGNADDFLLDVEKVRWMRSRRSFIGGGVAYCAQQLRQRRGEPAKMVVFGDGRSNYGNLEGALSPVNVAKQFLELSPANVVCAVAVGFSRTDLFTAIVGGDSSLVLKVTEWHRVLEILRDLVKGICDVDTPFRR